MPEACVLEMPQLPKMNDVITYLVFAWRLFYWGWESSCSSQLGIMYFLQLIQLRAADCWRDAAFFHPDFVARKWAMPWVNHALQKPNSHLASEHLENFQKAVCFQWITGHNHRAIIKKHWICFSVIICCLTSFFQIFQRLENHTIFLQHQRGWASPRRHTVAAPGANRSTRDLDESLWFRTGLKMRLPVAWDMISEIGKFRWSRNSWKTCFFEEKCVICWDLWFKYLKSDMDRNI